MSFMYNKLCNKQDGFFSNRSYLQKKQRSSNEIKKTYNPFYIIKSCLFCSIIFLKF